MDTIHPIQENPDNDGGGAISTVLLHLVFPDMIKMCFFVNGALRRNFPEAPIYTAALDSHLNENGYIVPGLGDAGDRCFGC